MFDENDISSIKVKKISNMFTKASHVFNQSIAKMQENLDLFSSKTTISIEAFQKKQNEMYAHLVRVFLVDLEKRIYTTDVILNSFMEVSYIQFYEAYKLAQPIDAPIMSFEEFTKRTNEQVQQHVGLIEAKMKAKREEDKNAQESIPKEG